MRRKLNVSVDIATLKQNQIDRQQEKYSSHPMYQMVSNNLSFDNNQFMTAIEEATDPSFSPMPPANYTTKDGQDPNSLVEPVVVDAAPLSNDPYSTKLQHTEEFAKPNVPHIGTLNTLFPLQQKLAKLQVEQSQGTEFIPQTRTNMILISENNTNSNTPIKISAI